MLYCGAAPVWTANPDSVIRSVACRPLSGRSRILWVSITVPTPALRVSTEVGLACTWIDSETWPTPSTTRTTGLLPTCNSIPVCR